MKDLLAPVVCAVEFLISILLMWPVLGPVAGLFYQPASSDQLADDEDMAIVMAQKFVTQQLKAPASASFPWSNSEYTVERNAAGNWSCPRMWRLRTRSGEGCLTIAEERVGG